MRNDAILNLTPKPLYCDRCDVDKFGLPGSTCPECGSNLITIVASRATGQRITRAPGSPR